MVRIRAKILRRRRATCGVIENLIRDGAYVAIEERIGARILFEECENFRSEVGVTCAAQFDQCTLLRFRKASGFMEQRLHFLPARAVHLHSPATRQRAC